MDACKCYYRSEETLSKKRSGKITEKGGIWAIVLYTVPTLYLTAFVISMESKKLAYTSKDFYACKRL